MCSPCSEFAVTLVASCPEDTLIDLTASSILGAILLSIAVKVQFLDYIFDIVNENTHFPVNLFVKTSFQRLDIHRVFIGCQIITTINNGNFSVDGTFIDYNTLWSVACSVLNNNVLVEVI